MDDVAREKVVGVGQWWIVNAPISARKLRKPAGRLGVLPPCERSEHINLGGWSRSDRPRSVEFAQDVIAPTTVASDPQTSRADDRRSLKFWDANNRTTIVDRSLRQRVPEITLEGAHLNQVHCSLLPSSILSHFKVEVGWSEHDKNLQLVMLCGKGSQIATSL